jgi:hypothetical protein
MTPGMQTRRKKAGMVLGVVFLMIPGRWAAAAEGAAVQASPPRDASSAAPHLGAPTTGSPLAPVKAAVDDERPVSNPRPPRRMMVDPEASEGRESRERGEDGSPWPPRLMVDPLTIEGASFYDAVGRPDLAASYRARHGWAVASRVVGGVSLGLGALAWVAIQTVYVAAAAYTLPFCILTVDSAATTQDCGKSSGPGTLWVPDIMMAAGLTLLVVPALWSNDPVSNAEKEDLARDAGARERRAPRSLSWNVSAAPLPGGQGGALSFAGRF